MFPRFEFLCPVVQPPGDEPRMSPSKVGNEMKCRWARGVERERKRGMREGGLKEKA